MFKTLQDAERLKVTYPCNNKQQILEKRLENISDEQGLFGKCWNGLKELTTLGISESDCENMVEKYNNGQISFEEALEYINKYEAKQKSASGLITNILTGVGAIAGATALVATGGKFKILNGVFGKKALSIGLKDAIKYGAPIGAILKPLIGIFDRATNNVTNDELNTKQIVKDFVSGAVTGASSAVASGVGAGIKQGNIGLSIKNGALCGAACGGASGAINYITNTALDEDKEFNFLELITKTGTSAFISGTVGAGVGAGMYAAASAGIGGTIGQETSKNVSQTIIQDSTSSSLRKVLGQAETSLIFDAQTA